MIGNMINTENIPILPCSKFPFSTKTASNIGEIDIPKNSHAETIPKPVPKALGVTTSGTRVQIQTKYVACDKPKTTSGSIIK